MRRNLTQLESVMHSLTGWSSPTPFTACESPLSWSARISTRCGGAFIRRSLVSELQVPNTKYKPPTVLADMAAQGGISAAHARALTSRYGSIAAVNLANSHGSEGKLGKAYSAAVAGFPPSIPFTVFDFDFHKTCGSTNYGCALPLGSIASICDYLTPVQTPACLRPSVVYILSQLNVLPGNRRLHKAECDSGAVQTSLLTAQTLSAATFRTSTPKSPAQEP
jgi:hypothetical protein